MIQYKSHIKNCIILLVCAVIVRMIFAVYAGNVSAFPDTVYYERIAENIRSGHGAIVSSQSVAMRMPGYPYVLAFVQGVMGTPDYYQIGMQCVQSCLDAAIVCAIYACVAYMISPVYGMFAGVAFIVNPLHVIFPSFMLSETLFSFCLVYAVICLGIWVIHKSRYMFFVSALFFIVALYIKESVLLLVPCYAVCAYVSDTMKSVRKRVIFMFLIVFLSLIPWIIRNYILLGEVVPLTTHGGITMYDSFNPQADGSSNYALFHGQEPDKALTEVGKDRYWKKKTWDAVSKNPWHTIYLAGEKFKRFWSPVPNAESFSKGYVPIFFMVYYVPILIFFCIGLFSFWQSKNQLFGILIVPIIYFNCLHMIFIGSLRYRMPVEPFIIMVAMIGIEKFLMIFWRKKL